MTDKEITCWNDAGSWESAQSLIGDSIFNHFTAVWKAIQERYAFLELNHPEIDLSAEVKHGDGILEWCNNITKTLERLIPYFAQVDENDVFAVSIDTPFCDEPISAEPNAKSFFREWDLPPGSPSWGQKYLYLHMVEYSMILTTEQTGFSTLLERTPATVNFTSFDAADLMGRYPLTVAPSIAGFLWNAYRILKLLYCPLRSVNIVWDPMAETYSSEKGFVLYHHPDGSCSYALEPDYPPEEGNLIHSETVYSEMNLWTRAGWSRGSGDVSAMKRELLQLSNGSIVWIVSKTTAGALIRNSSHRALTTHTRSDVPLNLLYERMYMDAGNGYFAPPYPEGEWIGAVDDLIPAAGTASYMENEIACPTGGTGSSVDSKRHCRLQVEVDLRYAFGFQFL